MMRRIVTAVVLLASAAAVSRAAAQRSHFGLHGGYNFDINEGLIGAQIHMPLSRSIELYPSFDYYLVNSGMPVVWPRVWLNGNNDNYGTTDAQNSGVVILRHAAIPLAMVDALWAKYKLGEVFALKEGDAAATRNIFAKPLPLPLPGTGVEELLAKGVMFGVCNVALTIYSGAVAQKMGMDAAAVKADWVAGLIPGCQVVPSGVLAVSRTQEKGCGYCFAG